MIFAKVDLTLAYHPKALASGRAMATWLWALLYSRDQELDGFVPATSLRLSWVGEKQAIRDLIVLATSGLVLVVEAGWSIVGYGAKNDTKAAIDERRKQDRERKRNPHTLPPDSGRKSDGIPGSGSGTGLDPRSQPPPTAAGPVPDWFSGAVQAVAANTGETLDVPRAWLMYQGHRETKGKAVGSGDARSWIAQVLVPEARRLRQSARVEGGASERSRRDLTGYTATLASEVKP